MGGENEDQRALRLWITAGLAIPEVAGLHGDAAYLLGNMIAKYTLATSEYAVSEAASEQLRLDGVDLGAVHARRSLYGKKSRYIYEHSIPASVVRSELLAGPPTAERVATVLGKAGEVAVLLRTEDDLLRECGLARRMPAGWRFGDSVRARYDHVGIRLAPVRLRMTGKIMR